MAIPSKEYWALRAVQREEEAFARGAELSMRLYDAYQQAVRELRRAVNDFYVRYARENRLTYEEAVKALNRAEAREWKVTLGEWVERIQAETDPRVRERLTAELDALSYRSRMDRLDALTAQARMTMDELYARSMREMAEEFGEVCRESFYKKSFDLQSRAGRYRPIAKFDAAMIENVMSYPWSGANFSDRLWQNKEALLFNIRQDLTQGLIRGTGLPVLSRDMAARMGQSYKAAERLVRTEVNHFHNEADKAAYRAAGVEWYEFMATLDARTCVVCGGLDGKRFKLSEARTGENYPPMHPNDRCTTVEWDPEGEADWSKSGKPMPEEMTYEEWRKRQGAEDESDISDRARRWAKSVTAHEKVVGFDALPKEYREAFREGLAGAVPEAKTVLRREYRRADYVQIIGGRNYYRYSKDAIWINPESDPSALAHELFHKLDQGHRISWPLSEDLTQDYIALTVISDGDIVDYLTREYAGAFQQNTLRAVAEMGRPFRGIADMLNGLSGGKINLGYWHEVDCWKKTGAVEAEAWAQFGRILYENDPRALKMLSELFPNFSNGAMLALKGLM